jgi:2-deoxy-D-gluconate 3-dehydrogenase
MLEKGRGAVINISSILGLVGTREAASYVASKHGLVGLTRALSMEWAGQGIRVNAVAPGLIQTDMTKYIWSAPEAESYIKDRIPAQRIGQPSDIGGAVVFLASDAADFIHGETLAVDGGFLAT